MKKTTFYWIDCKGNTTQKICRSLDPGSLVQFWEQSKIKWNHIPKSMSIPVQENSRINRKARSCHTNGYNML